MLGKTIESPSFPIINRLGFWNLIESENIGIFKDRLVF